MLRFLLLISLLAPFTLSAQDSTVVPAPPAVDSAAIDSLQRPITLQNTTAISFDSSRNYIITRMLMLNTQAKPEMVVQKPKKIVSKDWLFYYILGLLLMFAALRLTYARYFNDLFRFFFRTSLRVNQIKEQLVQSGLQSLLYNLFFGFSFGLYVYLLTTYFKNYLGISEWLIPLVATGCLLLLYLGKYLFLKFSGWLLGMKTATETYIFIVFLINKVAGIAILPFLILIAFSKANIMATAVTLSLVLVAGLFLYRFLRAYQPVQSEIKMSRLHFFIFFMAAEIAPLLIIYKLMVRYL